MEVVIPFIDPTSCFRFNGENGFLLTQISGKYQYGEDVAGIWEAPDMYRKLDAASIQQAAKTYLNTNNYVRVTLVPEKN